MRVDLFDFDLPEERIALRPASPRDAARMLVVRPGEGRLRGRRRARSAGPAAARRRARLQRHQGDPGAAEGPRARRRDGGASRDHAAQARGRRALARLRAAGQAARVGDRIRFGEDARAPPACSASSTPTVEEKGEAARSTLRFAFTGRCSTRRSRVGRDAAAALYRRQARRRRARPRRLPDRLRREEGAVAAPTAGLHFTDELFAPRSTSAASPAIS